jgi:hypothetical protein
MGARKYCGDRVRDGLPAAAERCNDSKIKTSKPAVSGGAEPWLQLKGLGLAEESSIFPENSIEKRT